MQIAEYRLHRAHLPLPRPIGDSQVRFTDHWMTVLELVDAHGQSGVGFELQQGIPTAGLKQLETQFAGSAWPALKGAEPSSVALRMGRPRGGNVGAAVLPLAIETAVWDLFAKSVGLPLYKLLGGKNPRVPAYGSTLDFPLTDDEFRLRLEFFKKMGFRAVKIKVGHDDPDWELRRMGIVYEVLGKDCDLMVDANEAWSPKQAIRRANLYQSNGFNIYWIEDPITREDYDGYRLLSSEIFTRINTGEYLGFSGKRRLLEAHGVDVLNVHGSISATRAAAYVAGDFGVPVSVGNTIMELGVHLAASLPECLYIEYSDLMWNKLAKEPVKFEGGFAIAPERPGHGVELDRTALAKYSKPD